MAGVDRDKGADCVWWGCRDDDFWKGYRIGVELADFFDGGFGGFFENSARPLLWTVVVVQGRIPHAEYDEEKRRKKKDACKQSSFHQPHLKFAVSPKERPFWPRFSLTRYKQHFTHNASIFL